MCVNKKKMTKRLQGDDYITKQKTKRQKISNDELLSDLECIPEEIWGYIINYQCDPLERFVLTHVCKTFCSLLKGKRMYKKYRWNAYRHTVFGWTRGRWIHGAAKKGYLRLTEWMLMIDPFYSFEQYHCDALKGAIKGGNTETMNFLLERIDEYGTPQPEAFKTILDHALKYGRLKVLDRVESIVRDMGEFGGYKTQSWNQFLTCEKRIMAAGANGMVGALNWYESKIPSVKIYLDSLFLFAVGKGHTNVLDWVMERKTEDDLNLRDAGFRYIFEYGIKEAAKYRHLHVLKWYAGRGLPLRETPLSAVIIFKKCCRWANGETLQWLKDEMYCSTIGASTLAAVGGGNLSGLKWLVKNGWQLTEECCSEAVDIGRLDILKWCLKKGVDWKVSELDIRRAITRVKTQRSSELLQFVTEYGDLEWNVDWTIFCVTEGGIQALNWIKEKDYYWKDARLYNAAELMLEWCVAEEFNWLLDNGCPFNLDVLLNRICNLQEQKKHKHAIQYGEKLKEKCKRIAALTIT